METGRVSVGWSDVDYEDVELDKDVGCVEAWLEGPKGAHRENTIYENLIIELTNVYPSYEARIRVEIANGGSIPVKLVGFGLSPVDDPDNLLRFVDCWIENAYWEKYPQLDPCQRAWAVIGIHIKDNNCPQGATATFEGCLEFVQWNMAP